MSECPNTTIGFTCGDLRGSTIPLGSFSSPEGARLYALALGIPREAIHVEAVTVSTPIYAEANAPGAERVRQAQKALAAFEGLSERLAPLDGETLEEALARQLAAPGQSARIAELETQVGDLAQKLHDSRADHKQLQAEHRELTDERNEIAEELVTVREAGEAAVAAAGDFAEDLVRLGGSLSGRLRGLNEALTRHLGDLEKLSEVLASLPDAKRCYTSELVTTATDALKELRDRAQREHDDPLPEQATDTLRALGLDVSTLDPQYGVAGVRIGEGNGSREAKLARERAADAAAKAVVVKPSRTRASKATKAGAP